MNHEYHYLYGLVKIIKKNIDIVCVPVIIEENSSHMEGAKTCHGEQSVLDVHS